jgi:hypothetical protein
MFGKGSNGAVSAMLMFYSLAKLIVAVVKCPPLYLRKMPIKGLTVYDSNRGGSE